MNTYRDNFDPVELNKKLTDDGYALLKNVLDKDYCNKLIQLCEENYQKFKHLHAKNKNKSHGLNDNVKEKLIYNLYNKSDEFLRLIDIDPVYEICKSQLNRGAFDIDEPITLRQMTARCPL